MRLAYHQISYRTSQTSSRLINSRLNEQYLPNYGLDKKSYMSFRLVPKSVTLHDLERRNGPYLPYLPNLVWPLFALFHRIRVQLLGSVSKSTFDI